MHLWPGCAITGLLITYAAYLAFGAWLFLVLEQPGEIQYQKDLQKLWDDFLQEHECVDGASLKEFVDRVLSGKRFAVSALKNTTTDLLWSFPSSLLFVSTLLTTVGYGYTVPVSSEGKVLCIVYVVLGIPLTLLLVSAIVQRLVLLFTCRYSHHVGQGAEAQRTIPCLHALVLICLAGIAFLFIPAVAFSALESNWDFTSAIYFCFVSLTTIGLGDYVPGQDIGHHFHGLYMISINVIVGLTLFLGSVEHYPLLFALIWFDVSLRDPTIVYTVHISIRFGPSTCSLTSAIEDGWGLLFSPLSVCLYVTYEI
uniref:Potassium two pore domain channel subfamily K member 1 n=1 Tax=Eptatretus burgeri TaxID=7764 RepID=A0A8C4QP87_EPTBU